MIVMMMMMMRRIDNCFGWSYDIVPVRIVYRCNIMKVAIVFEYRMVDVRLIIMIVIMIVWLMIVLMAIKLGWKIKKIKKINYATNFVYCWLFLRDGKAITAAVADNKKIAKVNFIILMYFTKLMIFLKKFHYLYGCVCVCVRVWSSLGWEEEKNKFKRTGRIRKRKKKTCLFFFTIWNLEKIKTTLEEYMIILYIQYMGNKLLYFTIIIMIASSYYIVVSR